MLKFRLPYETGTSEYLNGSMYLPVWGPQSTTEARLVTLPGSGTKPYVHTVYEEQMFHFNTVTRCSLYPNDVAALVEGMDHCYDCYAEVYILTQYLCKYPDSWLRPGPTRDLCQQIMSDPAMLVLVQTHDLGREAERHPGSFSNRFLKKFDSTPEEEEADAEDSHSEIEDPSAEWILNLDFQKIHPAAIMDDVERLRRRLHKAVARMSKRINKECSSSSRTLETHILRKNKDKWQFKSNMEKMLPSRQPIEKVHDIISRGSRHSTSRHS